MDGEIDWKSKAETAINEWSRMRKDLEATLARAERAEAAVAECQDIIKFLNNTVLDEVRAYGECQCDAENGDCPCGYCATVNTTCAIDHALSTDCGKDYVRREELDAAKAENARLREALLKYRLAFRTMNPSDRMTADDMAEKALAGKEGE